MEHLNYLQSRMSMTKPAVQVKNKLLYKMYCVQRFSRLKCLGKGEKKIPVDLPEIQCAPNFLLELTIECPFKSSKQCYQPLPVFFFWTSVPPP